jgi:hypothetical protein
MVDLFEEVARESGDLDLDRWAVTYGNLSGDAVVVTERDADAGWRTVEVHHAEVIR